MDLGFTETQKRDSSSENESGSSYSSNESVMATYKIGKNKAAKETGQPNLSTLNKCTPQIKKPPRRKTSPLGWFPRKKIDSYLQRKLKLLQEVDGMKSTLDETLGDSNPHYSKVLKEKMAAREAATKAMETRKLAMVEASWCRILQAARIACKDAEEQRFEAERIAAEAFETASSLGVIMYDNPDCPQKYCKNETSANRKGKSTTHSVSASFETAFEVDKQVASAVKTALTRLANCLPTNKEVFKELLRRICQNPDSEANSQEGFEFSSECESDSPSESEVGSQEDGCIPLAHHPQAFNEIQKENRDPGEYDKFNTVDLADMMLGRLKRLQEDELASLATIVATRGLNAALAEGQIRERNDTSSLDRRNSNVVLGAGDKKGRKSSMNRQTRRAETELPGLEQFLVKRLTRLEREVLEAKKARENEVNNINQQALYQSKDKQLGPFDDASSDFGTKVASHPPKIEKGIKEVAENETISVTNRNRVEKGHTASIGYGKNNAAELPSLDKFLVKHVSRLEKEVEEAKNRRNLDAVESSNLNKTTVATPVMGTAGREDPVQKEHLDHRKTEHPEVAVIGEDSIQTGTTENLLQKNCNGFASAFSNTEHFLTGEEPLPCKEQEKHGKKEAENQHDSVKEKPFRSHSRTTTECESLDKILVKHVSRLEKEKMGFNAKEEGITKVKKRELNRVPEESLDKLLVKSSSKLEREKMAAGMEPGGDQTRHSVTRREAREKELQAAWGGLSLGNSIRPHMSRLERDKAAWLKAEEEEKRGAVGY